MGDMAGLGRTRRLPDRGMTLIGRHPPHLLAATRPRSRHSVPLCRSLTPVVRSYTPRGVIGLDRTINHPRSPSTQVEFRFNDAMLLRQKGLGLHEGSYRCARRYECAHECSVRRGQAGDRPSSGLGKTGLAPTRAREGRRSGRSYRAVGSTSRIGAWTTDGLLRNITEDFRRHRAWLPATSRCPGVPRPTS